MPRFAPALALVLVALLPLPSALAGQEEVDPGPRGSWEIRGVADIGIRVASRDLGTNSGENTVLLPLAVVSRIETAPVVGVGLEIEHHYRTIGARAMFRTTLGGIHSGRPGVCEVIEGSICRDRESPVRVSSLAVEALFNNRRESSVRMTLSLGAGVRHYDFQALDCPADDPLCDLVAEMQADQFQPTLTFGIGLDGDIRGVPVHLKIQDFLGSFRTQGVKAEGGLQNDLVITFGAALPFN